jgi:hypothetical protein
MEPVGANQGPCDAELERARLAGLSATVDVSPHVERA